MLKLTLSDRTGDIKISLKHPNRFWNGQLAIAFLIASLIHLFALFIFKIEPIYRDHPLWTFPPIAVSADPIGETKLEGKIDEQHLKHPLMPPRREPKFDLLAIAPEIPQFSEFKAPLDLLTPACISHTRCSKAGQTVSSDGSEVSDGKVRKPCRESPLEPDGGTDVQICPAHCGKCRLDIDRELRILRSPLPKVSPIPVFNVIASGPLAKKSWTLKEEPTTVLESPSNPLQYAHYPFLVHVDDKKGEIFWYEFQGEKNEIPNKVREILSTLRFEKDLDGFVTTGTLDILVSQDD